MYQFLLRPRWLLFHLLVIAGVAGMISAAFWQLRRHDERQAFNATVEARIEQTPVAIEELLAPGIAVEGNDLDAMEWRPVVLRGAYVADEDVIVVNKSQQGVAGTFAVTPLELGDGRLVLVERGFVALSVGAAPSAPRGPVEVIGRLRPTQERSRGGLSDPAEGDLAEAQRIDIQRLAPQLPGDVVAMYVELTASDPAEPPVLAPIARPESGDGPHLSYVVQWAIFAVCAVVGWVLAVRRSITTHRHQLATAEGTFGG